MNERSFIQAGPVRARDPQKEKAIRGRALETIVRDGFRGLSMQKLAKDVGVSPATIYIYFESRDDLILSLYREESRKMAEATMEGFDPGASLAVGLRVQWKNRARYCLENPREAHFLEQIRHSPFHAQDESAKGRDFIEAMRAFCRGAIARGELVRVPVEVYWSVAFAPLYQLLKFHLHGRGLSGTPRFTLDERLMDQTLDLVVRALTPAPRNHLLPRTSKPPFKRPFKQPFKKDKQAIS
jgi:TetR/AcrR family transcriptional regulator, multidrug resistance operon repressor